MTYIVSSGTLNPTILYYTLNVTAHSLNVIKNVSVLRVSVSLELEKKTPLELEQMFKVSSASL